MSLTSWIIKKAVPAPKVESFQKYLFVGPHPDDIEIGAGATIARLAAEGKQITFLIATDGRYGLGHSPKGTTPEALVGIRREESIRSARALGVEDVRFLDLSDGSQYEWNDLRDGIARVIGEVQPDIVFAPDPCVPNECHADHLDVGEAVRRVAFFAPHPDIMHAFGAEVAEVKAVAFYMTARPNRFFGIRGYRQKQLDSILCHKSQFPKDSDAFRELERYLKIRAVTFGLRAFTGEAEGFRVLDKTSMHCLPEAGE